MARRDRRCRGSAGRLGGVARHVRGALGELWESVVADHRDARGLGPSLADNVERVLFHPLDWRTPAGALVPIGLVCAVIVLRKVELLALGAWLAVSAVFLMTQQPLLDHHFVLLAATLAVPAGAGLGAGVSRIPAPARYAVAGAAALALAVGFAQEERRLWGQDGDSLGVTWAADQLRQRTQPHDLVATDLPIVPYLADRRVPGQLVDSSYVRLGTGSLTEAEFLEELDNVRAVVVGRELANRPRFYLQLVGRYKWRDVKDGVTIFLAP